MHKILLIEDHSDARELLCVQFRSLGYEVIEAESAENGIQKALDESPDLIITDLELPNISGIEATVRLKEEPRTSSIPILAYTGWADEERKGKAFEAGIARVLTKPISLNVLQGIIERIL